MNTRKLTREEAEDKAISYFIQHLKSHCDEHAEVVDTPDRRGVQGGCDYIIARGKEKWAVDVTDLDSYPRQRDDAARALQFKPCVEDAARQSKPHDWVNVEFKPQTIPKGLSPDQLRPHLEKLLSQVKKPDFDKVNSDETLGFPIRYWVEEPAGNDPDAFLWVRSRNNVDQAELLKQRIESKNNQLKKYKDEGYKTAVLLDMWDMQLSNPRFAANKFANTQSEFQHSNLDEIWIALSITEPYRVIPLKRGSWSFSGTLQDVNLFKFHMSRHPSRSLQGPH